MEQMEKLDQLVDALHRAKIKESNARVHRIAIEREIIGITGVPEEGTQTAARSDYTLRVVGKLSRKMDWQKYDFIVKDLDVPMKSLPVKTTREIDLTKLKALKKNNPVAYDAISHCIEVKPVKPYVTIKLNDEA